MIVKASPQQQVTRLFWVGLWVLLGAGGVVGIVWFNQWAWRKLLHNRHFQVNPAMITIKPPSWASPKIAEEIRKTKGLDQYISIYEKGATRKIALLYERSPWVEKVLSVRRCFPNGIRLKLILRRPVAAVAHGDDLMMVDRHGVLLRQDLYRVRPKDLTPPVVVIDPTLRIPDYGQSFPSESVAAGASLAAWLRKHNLHMKCHIEEVDVRNYDHVYAPDDTTVTLVLKGGLRIKWGKPDGFRSPTEPSDAEKANCLLATLQSKKLVLQKAKYLDVRWGSRLPPVIKLKSF